MSRVGMRINLLKNRHVLTEKDYLKERQFLKFSILGLLVVVVITVAAAGWNIMLSRKLKGIEDSMTKLSSQMQALSGANAEQVYVKSRLKLIGNFLNEQSVARESLQQVLVLSLPGVTIGGLSFEEENEISVTVTADSQKALTDVVDFYKAKDGYFSQVVSDGVNRNKDGGYDLKLRLTLPKVTDAKTT